MMRFAVLGADSETIELLRFAVGEGGHALVSAFDSAPLARELRSLAPGVRLDEDWESLVMGAVDLVVVGRGLAGLTSQTGISDDERRADQLRKLAQAAVPMLVTTPACEAIVGYEIEMIRRDAGGPILPYVPGAANPCIRRLADFAEQGDASPVGAIEQIHLQRTAVGPGRDAVLAQFARDATILRQLMGRIQSVNATGPPQPIGRDPLGPKSRELPPLNSLSVHLTGDNGLAARWSIGPAFDGEEDRLLVTGSRGRATVTMQPLRGAAGPHWSWELVGALHETAREIPRDDWRQVLAEAADAAVHRRYDEGAWLAACRDQEAAEAIDRSLARGRTIELFNEEISEAQTFKGIMAMGGCLLLVMALAVVGLATIVEGLQLPLRDWVVWQWWPAYLLLPVVLFLLLQLLQFAIKPGAQAAEGGGEPPTFPVS